MKYSILATSNNGTPLAICIATKEAIAKLPRVKRVVANQYETKAVTDYATYLAAHAELRDNNWKGCL